MGGLCFGHISVIVLTSLFFSCVRLRLLEMVELFPLHASDVHAITGGIFSDPDLLIWCPGLVHADRRVLKKHSSPIWVFFFLYCIPAIILL